MYVCGDGGGGAAGRGDVCVSRGGGEGRRGGAMCV